MFNYFKWMTIRRGLAHRRAEIWLNKIDWLFNSLNTREEAAAQGPSTSTSASPSLRHPNINEWQARFGRCFGVIFSHLDFYIILCFFIVFWSVLGGPMCRKACPHHAFLMFSTFQKTALFLYLLVAQSQSGTSKIHTCRTLVFSCFFSFACARLVKT